jgi:hypothetical protein
MEKKESKPKEQDDLGAILDRCQGKNTKKQDLNLLAKELDYNPAAIAELGDLTRINIEQMAAGFNNPGFAVILEKYLPRIKKDLGYELAPAIEKLSIDGVAISWLRWQQIEYKYTWQNRQGLSLNQAAYWDKSLSAAHARYLKALESLAKIRKLARHDPALQVNIATQGGQQVNVAGDLVRADPGKPPENPQIIDANTP